MIFLVVAPFPPREHLGKTNIMVPMVPTNFTGTINDNRMDLATDTTWIYEVSVSSVVGENSIILNLKGGTREPPDPFCSGLIAQVFVSKVPKNVQEHESQYSGNIGPPSKVPAILEPPFSSSSPVKRTSSRAGIGRVSALRANFSRNLR